MVYLDMNVWVAMAKGIGEDTQSWVDHVASLARLVESGKIVIPLSAAHYLELWHRLKQESREDIGRLMQKLSGFATLAPVQTIRKLEIEAFVSRVTGIDKWVNHSDILGNGVCHAFGSRFGRFRFVESLASQDGTVPEGRPVAAPTTLVGVDLKGPEWEWIQLVGTPEILASYGVERTPEHRIGSQRLADELRFRELLRTEPRMRERLRDLLITDELTALTTVINQACWEPRVQPHSLFLENPSFATPAEAMREFVLGLPSVDARITLREWKHRDLNHPWEQHDHTDIYTLAAVIPYVDIIITERRWAHMVKASGLAKRHKGEVKGLSEFASVVETLTNNA
ncbi:hypothetical protein AB0L13_25570 [Saccharopolyspora shandongensis]|uniref:hypothetical protein n=1 Tax=Saccharopolyspora shandongensis TaxID=418495 RepID=UPI003414061D